MKHSDISRWTVWYVCPAVSNSDSFRQKSLLHMLFWHIDMLLLLLYGSLKAIGICHRFSVSYCGVLSLNLRAARSSSSNAISCAYSSNMGTHSMWAKSLSTSKFFKVLYVSFARSFDMYMFPVNTYDAIDLRSFFPQDSSVQLFVGLLQKLVGLLDPSSNQLFGLKSRLVGDMIQIVLFWSFNSSSVFLTGKFNTFSLRIFDTNRISINFSQTIIRFWSWAFYNESSLLNSSHLQHSSSSLQSSHSIQRFDAVKPSLCEISKSL